jgi:hypothetical protein
MRWSCSDFFPFAFFALRESTDIACNSTATAKSLPVQLQLAIGCKAKQSKAKGVSKGYNSVI